MNIEECNDWRIFAKVSLAKDMLPAYPGGPSHKAGAPIYLSHLIKSKQFGYLGFITPSLPALSLNIAINSAINANNTSKKICYEDCFGTIGQFKQVLKRNTTELYDFFESYMICVTFSFQAIEIYCNSIISKESNRRYKIIKKNQISEKFGYEVERDFSTEDKITYVLPQILNTSLPKKGILWQKFIDLKFIRDSIVHLKSPNIFSKFENIDEESIFYLFFKNNPFTFPKTSVELIQFFEKKGEYPAWLICLINSLENRY